ncbi:hypothetical protein [Acidimangrovimonas sediminis]|uniref:hypothetical protein n=1 Tax=Acidimangrovimonas sediminis TaxID=2056283 RepID=UPI000C7FD75C|nr:hypothetical protein [Acidimangrovimonas sediminis]
MSLGGPTGTGGGGALPPLPGAGAAALRQLAQAGWVEGRISQLLPGGGARIATVLGLIVAPEAGAGLMPGDRVRLRMNPQTGQVEAEALRPGTAAPAGGSGFGQPGTAAPAPIAGAQTAGAQSAGSPSAASSTPLPPTPMAALLLAASEEAQGPHLNSVAFAGLAPVPGGAAGALGAALPPPGSPLYGLIAALFPPDQRARRETGRTRRDAAPAWWEAFAEDAEAAPPPAAPDPPEPARRDPLDVVEWAPVETSEESDSSAAGQAADTAPGTTEDVPSALPAVTEDCPPKEGGADQVARLSGRLPDGGKLRLDARRAHGVITLLVTSDAPLSPGIARLIRAQAEALARTWGARLACSFRTVSPGSADA